MLPSVIVGLLMAMVTIAIHAMGTNYWISRLRRLGGRVTTSPTSFHQLRILCTTAVALLTIHIIEVVLWAMVYLLLVGGQEFETLEEAVYFSTVTFASLGYGDVVIESRWRLLGAIEAMVGLLVFGWSAALLFAVVQKMLRVDEDIAGG